MKLNFLTNAQSACDAKKASKDKIEQVNDYFCLILAIGDGNFRNLKKL